MPLVHRGYSVLIKSEGKELPQYNVEVVDERTITCWIPSEAGKTFLSTYCVVDPHDHEHFVVELFADGRNLLSETSQQSFLFSEVHLASDDDANNASNDILDDIATIVLEIWVAEQHTHERPYAGGDKSPLLEDDLRIPERSKLLGVNHVKPGATESYEDFENDYITYTPIGEHPYAVFRFKHRPTAVLQAMGIMPRPTRASSPPLASASSSTPSKRPRDSENVSHKRRRVKEEELQVKLGRSDELEAKRRRMKAKIAAERAEAAAHEAKAAALEAELEEIEFAARDGRANVKSEREPSPIRLAQLGEIVDLTED